MGVIIDKTNTRWGKARPWVLWSAPPLVVSLIMIFTVPNIGANGKAIYMLLVYIFLAAVCFTASNLSYNTMLSLVTTEQHDRNVMNTIRFDYDSAGTFPWNRPEGLDLHEYYLCDRSTWNVYYNICRNKRKI